MRTFHVENHLQYTYCHGILLSSEGESKCSLHDPQRMNIFLNGVSFVVNELLFIQQSYPETFNELPRNVSFFVNHLKDAKSLQEKVDQNAVFPLIDIDGVKTFSFQQQFIKNVMNNYLSCHIKKQNKDETAISISYQIQSYDLFEMKRNLELCLL